MSGLIVFLRPVPVRRALVCRLARHGEYNPPQIGSSTASKLHMVFDEADRSRSIGAAAM